MDDNEKILMNCSDAELVVELRKRMTRAADYHLSKLGIMLINLGADAVIEMGDRNVQAAIQEGVLDTTQIPDLHQWSNAQEPENAPPWTPGDFEEEEPTDSEIDQDSYMEYAEALDFDDGLDDTLDEPYTPGTSNPYGHIVEDAHLEREFEDRITGGYEID